MDHTFADQLLAEADPRDGCVPFSMAAYAAGLHAVGEAFRHEYRNMLGERVDAGEFLVWLGY
jgi:hypothetical protein